MLFKTQITLHVIFVTHIVLTYSLHLLHAEQSAPSALFLSQMPSRERWHTSLNKGERRNESLYSFTHIKSLPWACQAPLDDRDTEVRTKGPYPPGGHSPAGGDHHINSYMSPAHSTDKVQERRGTSHYSPDQPQWPASNKSLPPSRLGRKNLRALDWILPALSKLAPGD